MTEKFTAIILRNFKGGLHLSLGKEDNYDRTQTMLHSDTLKSAIAVCALQLGLSEGGDELKKFMKSFCISSAYPMATLADSSNQYFFPKPNIADRLKVESDAKKNDTCDAKKADTGDTKKAKKIAYVEKSLFEKLLVQEQTITSEHIKGGKFAFDTEQDTDTDFELFETQGDQHVTIPRDGASDSTPYFMDKLYFNEGCGMFFLTDAKGDALKHLIACIKLLADNGIGTDRTTGHGQFVFDEESDVESITLHLPENASHQLCLSLYCPHQSEISEQLSESYYDLIKRGGFIANPANDNHLSIRKKTVYMFAEGSLFPNSSDRKGKIVDLKPDDVGLQEKGQVALQHPIWRDGTGIFLPFAMT